MRAMDLFEYTKHQYAVVNHSHNIWTEDLSRLSKELITNSYLRIVRLSMIISRNTVSTKA